LIYYFGKVVAIDFVSIIKVRLFKYWWSTLLTVFSDIIDYLHSASI